MSAKTRNGRVRHGAARSGVLLSFAQFEREVIAERVRDKVAQSKARGIWMGGVVPLGYNVQDRKLMPNAVEAATVAHIFRSYLDQPSVRALKLAIDGQGVRTKIQQGKSGPRGGVPFSRGALYWLLSNPIYIGKLRHKDRVHEGQHEAIISPDLWDAVQAKLAVSTAERANAITPSGIALFTGMIRDAENRPMSPSFTVKQGRRYHYYVSSISKDIDREASGVGTAPVARIAAPAIEAAARDAVRELLLDPARISGLDDRAGAGITRARIDTAAELARQIGPHADHGTRNLFERFGFTVEVHPARVVASLSASALIAALDHLPEVTDHEPDRIALVIRADVQRGKRGTKLVIAGPKPDGCKPDPRLINLIVRAHRVRSDLFGDQASTRDRHIERLARLAYLAPDITHAILDGKQPAALTSRRLLKLPALPLAWPDQRRLLGFT